MIDPLSVATGGFFTAESENMNSLTRALDGYILFGMEVLGGGSFTKSFLGYPHELWPEIVKGKARTEKLVKDGKKAEVEITEPDAVIQPIVLRQDAPSISDIKDALERDLARELRRQAILDHAEKERLETEKHRKFKKQLAIMMIIMLDEM